MCDNPLIEYLLADILLPRQIPKTASTVMRSTEDLLKYSIKRIGSKTKENLLVCYMNSKLQLIHAEVISVGTVINNR